MKKSLLLVTILVIVLAFSMVLFACNDNSTDGTDNTDAEIMAIYDTYVAYAQENGTTPLSYEEWLATIKGEKGEKGENGDIGSQGPQGEQGIQGIQGEPGKDGHTPVITIVDGYWYIDGIDTGVKAKGEDGSDGKNLADIYNNVYNVTVSPSLEYNSSTFLVSTNDSTDRTLDIATILKETGYCQLGLGVFYVANLHMPIGSTLCGSGNATQIILSDSVIEGYAIRVNTKCTIRDLSITSLNSISISKNIGERHGIMFCGTYDSNKDSGGMLISISNIYISNFTGGAITCYNTGYPINANMGVSDVVISNCNVGINIAYWSEYHRFTNVVTNNCYYGCINNGGNNMFVNCAFNSNVIGFMIDNSKSDQINTAHGSVVGCTFNHSGSNTGYAIKIYNTSVGFIFEGCQFFYSKILLDRASGIVFAGCNFGRGEGLEINQGGAILFNNCVYGTAPVVTIVDNEYTHFNDCYLRSGESIDEHIGTN